jgi:hypothetical protein
VTDYERNLPTMPGDATPPLPPRAYSPLDVCPHRFPWWRVLSVTVATSFFVDVLVRVLLAR